MRMNENWEYRGLKGEPRVLQLEVFQNNLGQKWKNKRAHFKRYGQTGDYMFGRSEGEVRARLVSCHVFIVSLNHNPSHMYVCRSIFANKLHVCRPHN